MATVITKCPHCTSDIVDRYDYVEPVCPDGDAMNKKIYELQKAVKKHYFRLDQREHGGTSQSRALDEIEAILGLYWEQGAMTRYLEDHPKMKPFYES